MRSPAVAAVIAAGGIPVDAEAEALVLSVRSLRRYAAGVDTVWARVERIWGLYDDSAYPATSSGGSESVAPPAGHASRGAWAPPFRPFGPVGVLLVRLWR
eukprot:1765979-Lingulodinium_polyedra.AAC.1